VNWSGTCDSKDACVGIVVTTVSECRFDSVHEVIVTEKKYMPILLASLNGSRASISSKDTSRKH
jgi:hypothetical protein